MSKYVVSTVLASTLMAALSLPVFAANDSGTVNFAGKIVADTCEIDVDGSGSNTSTVTFADTYPSDFGTDGQVGTSKAFKIEVKKCDPLVAKLNLKFSGTTTDAEYKRLKNDLSGAGNATNVGIIVSNEMGLRATWFSTDPNRKPVPMLRTMPLAPQHLSLITPRKLFRLVITNQQQVTTPHLQRSRLFIAKSILAA